MSDDSPIIAIAGDWHGKDHLLREKLFRLAELGVTRLHHVGDVSIYTDRAGALFLDRVNGWAAESGVFIVVTTGNHEDWSYLWKLFDQAGAGMPGPIRSHVSVLPRGYRWTQRNQVLMSFGGTASIDRYWRVPGVSWWPEELPTEEDIVAVTNGGRVDMLITHDSPNPATPKVASIRATHGSWEPPAIAYAETGAAIITRVWEATQPKLLVHGHFHVRDSVRLNTGQQIVSLAKETPETSSWSI
ncbi:metallophosphoesterase [Glaciihabitans sp. UYNi722]|uniref:metallophosphoesterase n=1 Tax=Glaciihabitans sp. UYNi722 TaxID=3156344 RepID=UPI003399A36C